jgi:hypothetical protein
MVHELDADRDLSFSANSAGCGRRDEKVIAFCYVRAGEFRN